MEKSVVLCSGGLNSAVLLALVKASRPVALLHARFGHRAAAREAEQFERLAGHFDVRERLVIDLPHIAAIGGSTRLDRKAVIEDALAARTTPSSCQIPGMIPVLVGAAYQWAVAIEADQVCLGTSENLGPPALRTAALMPEYSREYAQIMEQALAVATPQRPIALETPLIDLTRGDIIRLGQRLEVPFKLTWSCMAGGEAPCQRCIGCATRARGFVDAGQPDPLVIGPGVTAGART